MTIWLSTFEFSAYLDIIAVLAASISVTRYTALRPRLAAGFALRRNRAVGSTRARSRRDQAVPAANDDEDGADFAIAS